MTHQEPYWQHESKDDLNKQIHTMRTKLSESFQGKKMKNIYKVTKNQVHCSQAITKQGNLKSVESSLASFKHHWTLVSSFFFPFHASKSNKTKCLLKAFFRSCACLMSNILHGVWLLCILCSSQKTTAAYATES